MSIKIAFFDIDETIYNNRTKSFAPDAIPAIKKLQENGVLVCLCSSRPNDSIRYLGCHDQGIAWDAIIGSGGGTAKVGNEYVRKFLIDSNVARRFYDFCDSRGYCFEMIQLEDRHTNRPLNDCGKEFYSRFIDCESKPSGKLEENLTQFHLFARNDVDNEVIDAFPELHFDRYCWFAVDIVPVHYRKGDAIVDILQHFGLTKDESIGFGDDLQDLSIAENVGTFVAMGNGKPEVIAAADYVTTSVSDNGISNALTKLGLIK